jgi:hypothetical protein
VCGACLVLASRARAGPARRADIQERLLENRLELWESYARRTESLVARYVSTRQSSLLHEPLENTGVLAFASPATLVMRDDGPAGSTTRIEGRAMSITPNQASLPPGPPIDGASAPAAEWLRARLVALFAPGTGEDLVADCRVHVPRGVGHALELLPPRNSVERKTLRAVGIRLDPVGGAVLRIEIQEAQGDRLHIRLADHRQNVPPAELAELLARDEP